MVPSDQETSLRTIKVQDNTVEAQEAPPRAQPGVAASELWESVLRFLHETADPLTHNHAE